MTKTQLIDALMYHYPSIRVVDIVERGDHVDMFLDYSVPSAYEYDLVRSVQNRIDAPRPVGVPIFVYGPCGGIGRPGRRVRINLS